MKKYIIGTVSAAALVGGLAACGTPAVIDNNSQPVPAPRPSVSTTTATPAPIVVVPTPATVTEVPAAPAPVPVTYDPWTQISQYYNYIESGDYTDAWNMGSQAFMNQNGDNFQAFADGYDYTTDESISENWESGDTVNIAVTDYNTQSDSTQNFTCQYTVDTSSGVITGGSCSSS